MYQINALDWLPLNYMQTINLSNSIFTIELIKIFISSLPNSCSLYSQLWFVLSARSKMLLTHANNVMLNVQAGDVINMNINASVTPLMVASGKCPKAFCTDLSAFMVHHKTIFHWVYIHLFISFLFECLTWLNPSSVHMSWCAGWSLQLDCTISIMVFCTKAQSHRDHGRAEYLHLAFLFVCMDDGCASLNGWMTNAAT